MQGASLRGGQYPHLSDSELGMMIDQELDLTIRGYLDFLKEIHAPPDEGPSGYTKDRRRQLRNQLNAGTGLSEH